MAEKPRWTREVPRREGFKRGLCGSANRIDFEEIRASARQPRALNRKVRKAMGRDRGERLNNLCFSFPVRLVVLRVLGGFYFAGSAVKGSSARQVRAHIGRCAACY